MKNDFQYCDDLELLSDRHEITQKGAKTVNKAVCHF